MTTFDTNMFCSLRNFINANVEILLRKKSGLKHTEKVSMRKSNVMN